VTGQPGEARSGARWAWCLAAIYAIAIAGALAVVLAAPPGAPAKVPRRWLGAFAGYVWTGQVTSLAASWTVPPILRGSPPGRAGTWIGAEAPGGANGPFIQIGTNEERYPPDSVANGRADNYYAFWSDTAHNFHPQYVFSVQPGDSVTANLSLERGRWRLAIIDESSGSARRFTTSQETRASFNEAQWLQEDITNTDTNRLFPYPRLATVTFARLVADQAPPSKRWLDSQWMSPKRGSYQAPTPVDDDQFTVHPAQLSAGAAQYLGIVLPVDEASYKFDDELNRWSPEVLRFSPSSPSQAAINVACAIEKRALQRGISALFAAQWTPSVRRLIDRLVRLERVRLADLQPLAKPQPLTIPAWRYQWLEPDDALNSAGSAIRAALHAPQWTPY
jgi:hypothetical protein